MTKIVLILLIIFFALTFLRNILKRIRSVNSNSGQNPVIKKSEKNDDGNIVDAKFEEIK